MRKINYIKFEGLILALSAAMITANTGDKNLFGSVGSDLAIAEKAAQSGRQIYSGCY